MGGNRTHAHTDARARRPSPSWGHWSVPLALCPQTVLAVSQAPQRRAFGGSLIDEARPAHDPRCA